MIDGSKNVQRTPICIHCKSSWPLPHHYPNQQDAPSLEVYPAPSNHPTTTKRGNNQEPSIMIIGNIFPISVIGIKQIAKRLSVWKSQIINILQISSSKCILSCKIRTRENPSTVVIMIISTGFITHYFQKIAEYHMGNTLIRCR